MARKFNSKNTNKSASDLFYKRVAYKFHSFKDPSGNISNSKMVKDFWQFENLLYGRIDVEQSIVMPNRGLLKRLPSKTGKTFYAFDFVVDAFSNLAKVAQMRVQDGALPLGNLDGSEEPYIGPYEVERGYNDLHSDYAEYVEKMFDIFYEIYLVQRGKIDEIYNFDNFVEIFMEFVRVGLSSNLPFCRSSYSLSKMGSILNTGLVIEIANLDHGNDEDKQQFFLDNRRLEFHKNLAAEYGFFVDKNAPWRFVANLESSQMKEYIKNRYPEYTDLNSFFEKYYEKAVYSDIIALRVLLTKLYNQTVIKKPISKIPYQENGCIRYKIIQRERLRSDQMEEYGDAYWIERYIKLKNIESSLNFSDAEEEKIINYSLDLLKGVDFDKAMSYIDYKFRGLVAVPTSYQFNELVNALTSDRKYTSQEVEDIINIVGRSENTKLY